MVYQNAPQPILRPGDGTDSGKPRHRGPASENGISVSVKFLQPAGKRTRGDAFARSRLSRDLILLFGFPAKAGIHSSAARASDKWVPAFAGTRSAASQCSAALAEAFRRHLGPNPLRFEYPNSSSPGLARGPTSGFSWMAGPSEARSFIGKARSAKSRGFLLVFRPDLSPHGESTMG